MRKKQTGRKSKRPTKYEFEMLYLDIGMSAQEMADRYGVAKQTIYQWSNQFRKEEQKNA